MIPRSLPVRRIFMLACLAIAPLSGAEIEYLPRLCRGPYLQLATADSITIVWRTVGATKPIVRYGAKPDALARLDDTVVMRTHLNRVADGIVQYETRLTGLEPLTKYYYAVYDGDRRLAGGDAEHFFVTYPRPGQAAPLRFATYGDSHGDNLSIRQNNRMLLELGAKENRPIDLFAHAGDISAHGHDLELQRSFDSWASISRSRVIWMTAGNHEILRFDGPEIVAPYGDAFVNPTQGEAGGAPSRTEAFYSFDYGRVHFISLEPFFSDRSPDGPMAQWLKRDLDKVKAEGETDWIIVVSHSAFYGVHKDNNARLPSEMRRNFMPMLEEAGVDLILSGHWHQYDRSVLFAGCYGPSIAAEGHVLDDGDGDPHGDGAYRKSAGLCPRQGVVQVVAGTGGSILGAVEQVHPFIKKLIVRHGTLVVDIDGDTLLARFISREGEVLDRFGIVKRGQVKPQPVAHPKPPPVYSFRRKLPGDRIARIPPAGTLVALDGKLDEPAWKGALTREFRRDKRKLWMLYDNEGLLVGLRWHGASHTTVTERDGKLSVDRASVDLLVDTDRDKKTYYRFSTNPLGTLLDSKNGKLRYNPEWQVATLAPEPGKRSLWTAEIRVPWRAMELARPPTPDTIMGMNFRFVTIWGLELFHGRGDPRFNHPIRPEIFGVAKFGPGTLKAVIPPYATWRYLAGKTMPGNWQTLDFDDSAWPESEAGFGYGDIDNTTPLPDMKGRYTFICARRAFEVDDPKSILDAGLMVNYDDAFVAYLNGQEVLRVGVKTGSDATAKEIAVHEGEGPEFNHAEHMAIVRSGIAYLPLPGMPISPEYFSLKGRLRLFRKGRNVLAIEGHNAALHSKAFTLDPALYLTLQNDAPATARRKSP